MNESDDNGKVSWRETLNDLAPAIVGIIALSWIGAFVLSLTDGSLKPQEILLALGAIIGAPIGLWLNSRRTAAIEDQVKEAAEDRRQRTDDLKQELAEAAADRKQRAAEHESQLRESAQDREDRVAQSQKQILGERFSRATDQLGSEKAHIRAAACHAFGQIALEDWRQTQDDISHESAYYNTCIDILSGFTRDRCWEELQSATPEIEIDNNAGDANDAIYFMADYGPRYRLPADIESALKALSNCNELSEAAHPIDLEGTNLTCWKGLTFGLNLDRANLKGTNLSDITFKECSFKETVFRDATATRLDFEDCRFLEGDFYGFRAQKGRAIQCTFDDITFTISQPTSFIFVRCAFKAGFVSSLHNEKPYLINCCVNDLLIFGQEGHQFFEVPWFENCFVRTDHLPKLYYHTGGGGQPIEEHTAEFQNEIPQVEGEEYKRQHEFNHIPQELNMEYP